MKITFNEIKIKEIINTLNGKRLGRAIDIVFSKENNEVLGFVVPGESKFLRKSSDIFISINDIVKIGDDVILVKLDGAQNSSIISKELEANKMLKDGGYDNNECKQQSYIRFKKTKLK